MGFRWHPPANPARTIRRCPIDVFLLPKKPDLKNREAYRKAHKHCERCGKPGQDVHHIVGRDFHDFDDSRNLMRLCRRCHDRFGRTREGKIEGLHLKMRLDPLAFSLRWFDARVGYLLSGKLEVWLETTGEWHRSLIRDLLEHRPIMTLNEYQNCAMQTAIYPDIGSNLTYPTLGLAGEAGEVANKVKKIQRDGSGELDAGRRAEIRKELGGVLWYVAAVAFELDVHLEDVATENLAILKKRQEAGTIQGSGDNR